MLAAAAGFFFSIAMLAYAGAALHIRAKRVLVRSSPYEPSPAAFAGYLAEVAAHLDERPEPLAMTLDGAGRAHELDFLPDGRMAVAIEGCRRHVFSLRRRWIPDHEVPLKFGEGGRSVKLLVRPTDANRFRVGSPFRPTARIMSILAASFAAAAICATFALSRAALLFAAGIAAGAILFAAIGAISRMSSMSAQPPSGRRGQVMIVFVILIAVLALLAAMNADVFLAILGKNKMQNAGDAAALAAARSQGQLLNEIGRLNLERVEAILDGDYDGANEKLSRQDWLRLVGPVEGPLYAAQAAATENGAPVNAGMAKILKQRASALRMYGSSLDTDAKARLELYATALENAIAGTGGIAAGPDNMEMFDFDPYGHMLYRKDFYEAIQGRNWCWFNFYASDLLEGYHSRSDWHALPDPGEFDALGNSEVFPLGVSMRPADIVAAAGAENLADALHSAGLASGWTSDMISTNDALRASTNVWCFYDSRWDGWENTMELSEFMAGEVMPEYDVSGAMSVVRVISDFDPASPLSGKKTVVWTAAAKPIGCIVDSTGARLKCTSYGRLVLPSFTAARLIPIDAARGSYGETADLQWMEHVFIHLPQYIRKGPRHDGCTWCGALVQWEMSSFREAGRNWLSINSHTCLRPRSGGAHRSGGRRHGH